MAGRNLINFQSPNSVFTACDKSGFALVPQFVDEQEVESLRQSLSNIKNSSAVREKDGAAYGVRNLLNIVPEIREFAESRKMVGLVSSILGEKAKIVRSIFFDKTPEANWKVPWHQDLTIAVREKIETEGFTAWTQKAGIRHVQPPDWILEKILTLRIHLDDADETNGALKVVPKSHCHGRLSAMEIKSWREKNGIEMCRAKSGDVLMMRPLLVHSSSAGIVPKRRRIIHLDFSAENLPNYLQFYGS